MNKTLSARLVPRKGESLSGYLMRVAKANRIEKICLLLNDICRSSGLKENCIYHSLDTLTSRHVNVDAISKATGLSCEEIFQMTINPVYWKFMCNDGYLENPGLLLLKQAIETMHRRFCPICLSQNGTYKLVWQIKDIELCNIHHIPLTSACPECGELQPYITDQLGALKCHRCNADLFKTCKQPEPFELEYIRHQQYLYRQWAYLLGSKNSGLNPNPIMCYEKQMACTLLFLMFEKNTGSLMKFRYLSRDDRKKIYTYIKNGFKDKYKCAFITPKKLIKYLYLMDISVEKFFTISLPKEFINDLIHFIQIDENSLEKTASAKAISKPYKLNDEKSAETIRAVDNYILQRMSSKKLTAREIHKDCLSISNGCIPPNVNQYIRKKIDEYNQKNFDALVIRVYGEAVVLIKQGIEPSYQKVADRIGFHVSNIKRNPILINAINSAKEKHGL